MLDWKERLKGYCSCFATFPAGNFDTHFCDAKCPALQLRRQLQENKAPQKSVFTENLILVGSFSRKEIIGILEQLFKVQYNTASGKVDAAKRNLRYNKYRVFKTDDGRLVAHKSV
jgi:hypothetical protein